MEMQLLLWVPVHVRSTLNNAVTALALSSSLSRLFVQLRKASTAHHVFGFAYLRLFSFTSKAAAPTAPPCPEKSAPLAASEVGLI